MISKVSLKQVRQYSGNISFIIINNDVMSSIKLLKCINQLQTFIALPRKGVNLELLDTKSSYNVEARAYRIS